jgi:hypothetical protein
MFRFWDLGMKTIAQPIFDQPPMAGCPTLRVLCEGWDAKSLPAAFVLAVALAFLSVILRDAEDLLLFLFILPFSSVIPKQDPLHRKNQGPSRP